MYNLILALLLIWHVGSIIMWFGSSVTFVVAVYPSLGTLNEDQSRAYLHRFFPSFSWLLGGASASAAVSGLFLFQYVTSVTTPFSPTGWRLVFVSVGALLGLVAAVLTLGVAVPLSRRFLNPRSQLSNGWKYSVLDESTMLKGINGVMKSVVIILPVVFVMMVLAASL